MTSDREQAIEAVTKLADRAATLTELVDDLADAVVDVRRIPSRDSSPALRVTFSLPPELALRFEQATGRPLQP